MMVPLSLFASDDFKGSNDNDVSGYPIQASGTYFFRPS